MNQTEQTFKQRIGDTSQIKLAPVFISFIEKTATANGMHADHIWALWEVYSKTCDGYGQSAIKEEFLKWNRLEEVN